MTGMTNGGTVHGGDDEQQQQWMTVTMNSGDNEGQEW
jgi:hypothetical protein